MYSCRTPRKSGCGAHTAVNGPATFHVSGDSYATRSAVPRGLPGSLWQDRGGRDFLLQRGFEYI